MKVDFYMFAELDDVSRYLAELYTRKMIDLCLEDEVLSGLFDSFKCSTDDDDYVQHLMFDFGGAIIGPLCSLSDNDYEQGTFETDRVFLFEENKPIMLLGDALEARYYPTEKSLS